MSDDGLAGCALGMAGMVAGCETSRLKIAFYQSGDHIPMYPAYEEICRVWPWLDGKKVTIPCDCEYAGCSRHTGMVIAHLFDKHVMSTHKHWTLEQLIDWVRSVEPEEPTETNTETTPEEVTVSAKKE